MSYPCVYGGECSGCMSCQGDTYDEEATYTEDDYIDAQINDILEC